MQPQSGWSGWGIAGFFLNLSGSIMLFFEQNAGAFTVLMGLLAWVTGLFFQYRKDRREQREHDHRMAQVALARAFAELDKVAADEAETKKTGENDKG